MRYQVAYIWFIFLSVLDFFFSSLILRHKDGRELNPIADFIFQTFDLHGLAVFKAAMVVFIIILCETIGHWRDDLGRRISLLAVALTSIPVVMALYQLLRTGF